MVAKNEPDVRPQVVTGELLPQRAATRTFPELEIVHLPLLQRTLCTASTTKDIPVVPLKMDELGAQGSTPDGSAKPRSIFPLRAGSAPVLRQKSLRVSLLAILAFFNFSPKTFHWG